MQGHEGILKLRKKGFIPTSIFVSESTFCSDWFNPGEKYGEQWEMDYPHVCILPDEPIELLDLRFSVGTVVHISGDSVERSKAVLEAFKGAGAQRVIGCVSKKVEGKEYYINEWMETWPQS